MRHLAVHVGEAKIAATVVVGETLVIDAHQVEEGGVEIVDVHAVLHGCPAELVGGAVDVSALHAAAGQAERVAVGVVFAADRGWN